ncbi:LLM class flavin-dependent oxidoreductase [Hydrogenophaga sp.]|uniref:LLM class flavin-dependent oxidoreductase n=1 Tax=Hydrogenophaga sp. TaxID=1904254 RepID=UPI0027270C8D|nr:LLM class flavin-dependent oxidoreductase [Hydrogenophaga sp.]MDO9435157.1 LLM class flavin-dependent oxidoreductase [Hydrogenophaga sp.]
MKLGMFMMPVHPLHRNPTETLREDREAIILADQLGFHDAFVGEHLSDKAENITNSLIFLATLIHSTKQIKLASGTCNLSQIHPTIIAAQAAMFDHLAEGRFILGVSPGALGSDAESIGILGQDRNKMFAEAIDVILAIWEREAPYDIDFPDNRYKVSTRQSLAADLGVGIMPKPFQTPRPEIVGTVVAPFSKGVIAMGERDFHPLSANFLLPQWVKTHWGNYAQGKEQAGVNANIADWRVARTIFVADDEHVARSYGRDDAASPYRFYYRQMLTKLMKSNRHEVFKERREQADSEITVDYVLDKLCICGTVSQVVDEILALREVTGDFGELVYAGMDWVDRDLSKRSMQLMAEQVMPRVNAATAAGSTRSLPVAA